MNEKLKKIKEDLMLEELRNFIINTGHLPYTEDFKNKEVFSFYAISYRKQFGSMSEAIKKCGAQQYLQDPSTRKPKMTSKETLYKRNLISGKIRIILKKNKHASYEDLERTFGKVTRSITVTYYKIFKEMFNESGKLRKTIRKNTVNSIRYRVHEYFKKHRNHTIYDAAKDLNLSWNQVYSAIRHIRLKDKTITYRKPDSQKRERGRALKIRNYIKKYPKKTLKECAKATKSSYSYVAYIACIGRKTGKLPKKQNHKIS